MIGILGAAGVVLVAAPVLAARWGRRLHPADWARWIALSLVLGALAIEGTLALAAAPTVLRAAGVHGLASACGRLAGATPPGGAAVGWIGAVGAVVLPTLTIVSWHVNSRKRRRIASGLTLAPALDRFDGDVLILPLGEPMAFSVPVARQGRVVVSTALVDVLSDAELAAVVRHERAHLRCRHSVYLQLGSALDVALAVHPLVSASTAQLRCALERWADEEAAGTSARARATTRSALLAAALAPLPATVTGFGPVATVAARVSALERPAPRSTWFTRWAVGAPLAALMFVAAAAAGTAGGDLWTAWTMPVRCALQQS